jgi:uncharacterized caspase-like protein
MPVRILPRALKPFGLLALSLTVLAGCNATTSTKNDATNNAKEGFESLEDLYIVDCLLPGQVRRLGSMQYLSPRRALRTTTADCRIRGGEYVEYDRADYRSALKVWLPQAEKGDAESQNYVGEIFEKGLGQEPDYLSAVSWYTKAADQGYSRAQINLGYMYEKGLGVDKDVTVALNWYRKASGIGDDELMLSSDAQKELAATREKLNSQLASAKVQTDFLQKQIAGLKTEVEKQTLLAQQTQNGADPKELEFARQEVAALTELYEKALSERQALEAQAGDMEIAYRKFSNDDFLAPQVLERVETRVAKDINFGRYFALIIGNQDYVFLDDLRSPIQDGKRLQQILEQKYGFSTLFVPNASEKSILNTINDFYEQIGENDNLLIYYAGHGNISRSDQSRTERGYWLPVDAGKDNISNWINNSVISDHLDRLRARSVLVISDSCYAGYLGSEKSPFLFGVSGAQSEKAIQAGLSRRARVVISSGGVKPVLDGSNSTHSIFASALIDALEQNQETLRDSSLFSQLSVNVRKRSESVELAQTPEMKPVREAGHEGGTFYFVPVN